MSYFVLFGYGIDMERVTYWHMWPFTAPLGNSKVWECARVRNAHKSPSTGQKIFPSCKTHVQTLWKEKSGSLTSVWWGLLSASFCLWCIQTGIICLATRMTRYCGLRKYGGNRDAHEYKSLKVQIFRLATATLLDFFSSHALWQTHSNSDVCIGLCTWEWIRPQDLTLWNFCPTMVRRLHGDV